MAACGGERVDLQKLTLQHLSGMQKGNHDVLLGVGLATWHACVPDQYRNCRGGSAVRRKITGGEGVGGGGGSGGVQTCKRGRGMPGAQGWGGRGAVPGFGA